MSEYVIKSKDGYGSVTMYKECLPNKDTLKIMYESGFAMYKDGKKLSKTDALNEVKGVKRCTTEQITEE